MLPTVLITGCTQGGIGYSLAHEFANRNYHVFACARRIEAMGDLESLPNVTLLKLDLADRTSILDLHTTVHTTTNGKLDILYHNAGYRVMAMALDTTEEECFQTFRTNLFSIIEMNGIFADMLIASKGKIVFTGSISYCMPQPSQMIYNASKAALDMYSQILRFEMKPLGVSIVHVITAGVKTHMTVQKMPPPPSGSRYQYLEKSINDAWESYESAGANSADYAKTVVSQIVRRHPPDTIWSGYGATIVRAIEFFGFRWLYSKILLPKYGLDKPAPTTIQVTQ
ncbi:hypothetical protein B7463_g8734, partial [Scytalidium lignicola]